MDRARHCREIFAIAFLSASGETGSRNNPLDPEAMLPQISLVLGGSSSGKTAFAEKLAEGSGRRVVYIATADYQDAEMKEKIRRHRRDRPAGWLTVEAHGDAEGALAALGSEDVGLFDCVTMWLADNLLAGADFKTASAGLVDSFRSAACPVIAVSGETGLGGISANALARRFNERQGEINQRIAAASGLAVAVIAGIPAVLKGRLPAWM